MHRIIVGIVMIGLAAVVFLVYHVTTYAPQSMNQCASIPGGIPVGHDGCTSTPYPYGANVPASKVWHGGPVRIGVISSWPCPVLAAEKGYPGQWCTSDTSPVLPVSIMVFPGTQTSNSQSPFVWST